MHLNSILKGDSKSLKTLGVADGDTITFKDLGPQISYRGVFVIEYAGPIFLMMLYSLRPKILYGDSAQAALPFSKVAKIGVIFWIMHFLKREYETFFIHKFSRPTMPLNNLFKNSLYYWSFAAVIGYYLCHPDYNNTNSPLQVHIGATIFVLSEIGNLICHIMLSRLRPKEGSNLRVIPTGFLFNYVSCPNYTFEVLTWIGFSIMTSLTFSYVFTIIGLYQMSDWALKKHKVYLSTYNDEYKKLKRKAIIPFVL